MTPEKLDGTPEEFPHREKAKATYRILWETYLVTQDLDVRQALEQGMDAEQVRICRGPGPLWQNFADSLPGFHEFWERFDAECVSMISSLLSSEDG